MTTDCLPLAQTQESTLYVAPWGHIREYWAFYTGTLGLQVEDDAVYGPGTRWLTVV